MQFTFLNCGCLQVEDFGRGNTEAFRGRGRPPEEPAPARVPGLQVT